MVYAFDKMSQTMIKYLYTVFNDLWFEYRYFHKLKMLSEKKEKKKADAQVV